MNLSKRHSPRQWLIWKANGAVQLHANPAIARAFQSNALAELEGRSEDIRPLGSLNPVRTGDIVVHVPADGRRGYGLLYADNADEWGYGGDGSQVAVAVFSTGIGGWVFGLARNELVAAGHFDTTYSDRTGSGFTIDALRRMRGAIDEAREYYYQWFPTFPDGRSEALLSEMHAARIRSAFIADDSASGIEADSWELPGSVSDQIAYAVPRDGHGTFIEATAHQGKFRLVPPYNGEENQRSHYVVVHED